MGNITKAFVVDPSIERRNSICQTAAASNLVALPFEEVGELDSRWPDRGCFFVADEGSLIDQVLDASKRHGKYIPIIAYKAAPSVREVSSAMRAGSADYLQWPIKSVDMTESLINIGANWESLVGSRDRKYSAAKRLGELSERELEILQGMTNGLSNKEIGENLGISPRTVEAHRCNMKLKLQTENSTEATQLAYDGLQRDSIGVICEISVGLRD